LDAPACGAGQTGFQLLEAMRQNGLPDVVGFFDSKSSMWGQYVGDIKVYRPENWRHSLPGAMSNLSMLQSPIQTGGKQRRP
jgi:FlaA1/EpsC-like NDP-sugar epimerase